MNRFIIMAAAAGIIACGASVSAADTAPTYPYLSLGQTDGSVTSFEVEGLTMTCVDGMLKVNAPASSTPESAFDVASLRSLWFSTADESQSSAIATVEQEGADTNVALYTASGLFLGNFSSPAEARASVTASGIYILRGRSKTLKLIVR